MAATGRETWPTLLAHALLAPSPHNVQPWRVRILDDTNAELWIEKRRTLPKEDVTGSFIILTMGIFIETLRIVASHHGLALEDEPIHAPDWYAAEHLESMAGPLFPFARLRLRTDDAIEPGPALELLDRRRTSRLPYGPDPVDAAASLRLDEVARAWGHRYAQITDAARIERLLDLNVDAVFEDLNHAPYHDELVGWIRYTHAESGAHRDGLDARCMNVSPPELWLTFHAAPMLLWSATRPWFRRRYRRQIGPVSTMGFLSGRFWDPADAFLAGRLLIHWWLEATRLGYFLHPYGNLVTNRAAAARVEAETGIPDVWLAFKIGRSALPPRSRRLPVEAILL